MKSVGEVMAFGRSFQESLQKALRGMEIGVAGFTPQINHEDITAEQKSFLMQKISQPSSMRIFYVADAFRAGFSLAEVHAATKIDPWFLVYIEELMAIEASLQQLASSDKFTLTDINKEEWYYLKGKGFSDRRLAELLAVTEQQLRQLRYKLDIHPKRCCVDTCAAEFPTATCYYYLSYLRDASDQIKPGPRDKAQKYLVLGGGPNRIGQGIEFDYCCVHAAQTIHAQGHCSIMLNSNPETVSTDYDISDRLYFESVTLEDSLEVLHIEQPHGVIVQYGGQTPLGLATDLAALNVPIIGTTPDAIARAEDRERFAQMVQDLGLQQPPNGIVRTVEEGRRLAKVFAYPLMVRPSHVLGGRAMQVIYSEQELCAYLETAITVSPDSPLLLDHFLDNAVEVDVDAICDGEQVVIAGILEHIEKAGIHSGDSSCCLPPHNLSQKIQLQLQHQVEVLARELGVVGLINVQFAIRDQEIYLLEVNPRASRTVPFIAKAIGLPVVRYATECMLGQKLSPQTIEALTKNLQYQGYYALKQPVFPFNKFPGMDPVLGPEMRSTGEVMGLASEFGAAFLLAQQGAGKKIPQQGCAFISVPDADKAQLPALAKQLLQLGFSIIATKGTAAALIKENLPCEVVNKITEGRPHIVDHIKNGAVQFIVNVTAGRQADADARHMRRSYSIRRSAIMHEVWYTTTLAGAFAACAALASRSASDEVLSAPLSLQQRCADGVVNNGAHHIS